MRVYSLTDPRWTQERGIFSRRDIGEVHTLSKGWGSEEAYYQCCNIHSRYNLKPIYVFPTLKKSWKVNLVLTT
jgi:hypothetical protein